MKRPADFGVGLTPTPNSEFTIQNCELDPASSLSSHAEQVVEDGAPGEVDEQVEGDRPVEAAAELDQDAVGDDEERRGESPVEGGLPDVVQLEEEAVMAQSPLRPLIFCSRYPRK